MSSTSLALSNDITTKSMKVLKFEVFGKDPNHRFHLREIVALLLLQDLQNVRASDRDFTFVNDINRIHFLQ